MVLGLIAGLSGWYGSLAAQNLDTIAVLEASAGEVSFVDRTGNVVAFAQVTGAPQVCARTPSGAVWVGTTSPAQLILLSPAGGVSQTIPLAGTPGGIALDSGGNVWVSILQNATVQLYSPAGGLIISYPVGQSPRGVAIDPSGNCWVCNSVDGTVSRITGGLVFTFPVGGSPFGIATLPDGGVWFTDLLSDSVKHLSPGGTLIDTLDVGSNPQGIAIDGAGDIWVAASGSASVWRLNDAAILQHVYPVGSVPSGISIDGRGEAWVACVGSDEVYRLDPILNVATPYGGFPGASGFGDASGFARARVVDPNGDVDGDLVNNVEEIDVFCNPFDATLPEIGRISFREASIEGGAILEMTGCGFTGIVSPEVFIGLFPTPNVLVVSDSLLEITLPEASVVGLLDVELRDAGVVLDELPLAFRFLANPGQAWIAEGNNLERIPVQADGSLGTPKATIVAPIAPDELAVDDTGGVWALAQATGEVFRYTADGVLADQWAVPGPLGSLGLVPGGAWVSSPTTNSVYFLRADQPVAGPFLVGANPNSIVGTAAGGAWVLNSGGTTLTLLDSAGGFAAEETVGPQPSQGLLDLRGNLWITTDGDNSLHRFVPGTGLDLTVPLPGTATAIALGAEHLWLVVSALDLLLQVDSDGMIVGSWPTAPAPSGVAVDGSGSVWVIHATSGEIRRYAANGVEIDNFVLGTGRNNPGDFTGINSVLISPTTDHDGDSVCTGAEFQQGSDPFRPESTSAEQLYFEAIDPIEGFMTGGDPLTISGCGFAAGNFTVLIGGNSVDNLVVLDDFTATGNVPTSLNWGPADVVVSSDAGSVFVPEGYLYRTSPVADVQCEQVGVPVTVSWTEVQAYDSVQIVRNGIQIQTQAGGLGTYTDLMPSLGTATYEVIGTRGGEDGPAVSCSLNVILVAPSGLTCAQQAGSVVLNWTLGDTYDAIILERDGVPLEQLDGATTAYQDLLPPLGLREYCIRGVRGAFESVAICCSTTFELLPLSNLTCTPSFGQVDLTWNVAQPYDAVRVFRDGALLVELPGAPTSYQDTTVDEGPHDYEVLAVLQGTTSPAETCAVTVPVPPVTDLVCTPFVFDVTLDWQLGLPDYDAIRILRDGVEVAQLAGTATSYFDAGLALGTYSYEVVAEKNATLSAGLVCSAMVIGPEFVRADVNSDSGVDVADAIFLLDYLFTQGTAPGCDDAADANDDGLIDIGDGIAILGYLFDNGAPPPAPFPNPGIDPTPDSLGCATSPL